MRSSTVCGSSAGTFASAALTMSELRSSGRQSTSEPLLARPIGVRAVATMTASGMWGFLCSDGLVGEDQPELAQLLGSAAQVELDPLCPQVIAVQRVIAIDA